MNSHNLGSLIFNQVSEHCGQRAQGKSENIKLMSFHRSDTVFLHFWLTFYCCGTFGNFREKDMFAGIFVNRIKYFLNYPFFMLLSLSILEKTGQRQ